MAKVGRPRKCDQQKKTDIKLIDMSRIEVGDVIQTWSDDRDFLILSQVNGVGKIDGKIYIEVDELDVLKQQEAYEIQSGNKISNVVEISKYQHTKSAAIITELLEIIQSQSDALTDIDSWLKRMSDLKWDDDSYAPRFKKSVKNNSDVLSETNTRLQKLRGGK